MRSKDFPAIKAQSAADLSIRAAVVAELMSKTKCIVDITGRAGSICLRNGDIYSWISHMFSHAMGMCGFRCKYCYTDNSGATRHLADGTSTKRPLCYEGCAAIRAASLFVNLTDQLGAPRTYFMERCNDIMGNWLDAAAIKAILAHCCQHPINTYVFQSKNPGRFKQFIDCLPPKVMIGATIETNRSTASVSRAPHPRYRYAGIKAVKELVMDRPHTETFITVSPILDFDVDELSEWLIDARPNIVNISADSGHNGLIEPSYAKVCELRDVLESAKVDVRFSETLNRLAVQDAAAAGSKQRAGRLKAA